MLFMAALFAAFVCACGEKKDASGDPSVPSDPVTPVNPGEIDNPVATPDFALGADIGWASEMEAGGRTFKKKDGTTAPLLEVLQDCGLNSIRLRVWVDPYKGWSGKEDVLAVAKKVSAADMALMVDFHYSDFFADPSRQTIPAAWEADKADVAKMCAHVSAHTTEVLQALKDAGVTVNWIQIGNETRAGMLFGTGDLKYDNKGSEFANYVKLSNAGYEAAKAIYPNALVMPHIDNAWDASNNSWWLTSFKNQGGKMDAIALSHYPQNSWNGKTQLTASQANSQAVSAVKSLVATFKLPVIIAEIGVKTPAGEAEAKNVLSSFMTEIAKVNGVTGVFYWEPEVDGSWKPAVYSDAAAIKKYTGKSETWNAYNMGAFTSAGKPTSVMDVFAE
jgi:arabinogalactan endo-1,4-beta-galactosidase